MPSSQSPPVWPQMSEASGCRAASAARSIGVDSPGRFPVTLIQVCWKIDRLQLRGPLDDRVQLRGVGAAGDPELDADHRAVADAAVDLGEALLDVLRVHVDEPERPVVPVAQGLEHLVVLLAELLGRRVVGPGHAHVDAEPGDAHAVGVPDELGHALVRRPARDPGEVTVQVPDFHGIALASVEASARRGWRSPSFKNPRRADASTLARTIHRRASAIRRAASSLAYSSMAV